MSETQRIVLVGLGKGSAERMSSLRALDIELYTDDPAASSDRLHKIDLSGCNDGDIRSIVGDTDMTIVMVTDKAQEETAKRIGDIAESAQVPFTLLALERDALDHREIGRHFRGIIVLDTDDVGCLLAKILEVFMYPSLINLDLADLRTVLGYGREALVDLTEFPEIGSDDQSPGAVVSVLGEGGPGCGWLPSGAALVHIVGGKGMTVKQMDTICRDVGRRFHPRHMIMGLRIEEDAAIRPSVLSIVTRNKAA